ncbi:toxin glutamine deamidase domain-containing protein [Nocardia sp. NPDC049149]|uniref:toxin glutamine deamidase domain-containing protein n=1 Tax=Nocardia sp. NPDC049149 TaxID=3364315 RepID=UPI00371A8CC0
MGIEIPESLQWVAKWIVGAGDWPEGDETAMWRVSDAWSGMASALNDIDDDAHHTVQQVLAVIDGQTHDSIEAYRDELMGEQGAWAGLVKYLDSMADQIGDGAADIEQTKLVIIGTMVVFAIEMAPLLATAWTGISAAGAVALRAGTQIAIRMAIKELITRMLTRAAAEAAARAALHGAFAEALEEGGLEIGTKFLQLGTGHRNDVTAQDWKDAGVAAAAGAAGGAVGAGLGSNGLLSGASDAASSRLSRATVEGTTEGATGVAGEIAGAATTAALTDQPFNLTLDSVTSSLTQGVPAGAHAAGNHHSDTDAPPAPNIDRTDRNMPPAQTSDGVPATAPNTSRPEGTASTTESLGAQTNLAGAEQNSTPSSPVDSTSPASADRSPTETTQKPADPTVPAHNENAAANATSPQAHNLANVTPDAVAVSDTSSASESALDQPKPSSTTTSTTTDTPTTPAHIGDTSTTPAHTGDAPPAQTQSLASVGTDTAAPAGTTIPTDNVVGQPVSIQPSTDPPGEQPAQTTPSPADNLTNPAPPKHDTPPVAGSTPSRIDSSTSAPTPPNPTTAPPAPSESPTTTTTPDSTTAATATATPLGAIPNTTSVTPTGEPTHRTTTTPDPANPPQTTTSAPSTAAAQPSNITSHATGPTPPAHTSPPPTATSGPATIAAPPPTGPTPPATTSTPPGADPRAATASPTPSVADHARQNVATPTTADATRSAPAPASDPGRPNSTSPVPSASDAARQPAQAPIAAEPARPTPARTPTDLPRPDTPPRTPADPPRHETRPPIDGFIAHAPDSLPQQHRPGHAGYPRQSTRHPVNPVAHQPDQARAAREHFRNQTPEAGRVTPVIVSADPFAANTPAFDVRRFPDQSISVITIRVHIDAGPYVSSQDIRNLIETAQTAADRAFNSAPRLLNGDRLLIDVVFAPDPTTAHLRVTANQAPGNLDNWSIRARPESLINNIRQQLGLFPHEPGTSPARTAEDLRQLSNDIAAANTPAHFTGLPNTHTIDHHRLSDLEDAAYQAMVEDSLRDDNTFTRGADPRTHPYGRLINDGGPTVRGRRNNCLDNSLAALSSFFGRPQVALPRWPDLLPNGTIDNNSGERGGLERAAGWLGRGLSAFTNQGMSVPEQFDAVHHWISQMGPGSAALVVNVWHARGADGAFLYDSNGAPLTNGSHATVIVYPPGTSGPVWWDPQSGATCDHPPASMVGSSSALAFTPIPPDQGAGNA